MGKALRKEKHAEKWEKAILNLSTYATCAPGPISYVNEKEATETTLTIFGSFEFSLEVMPENSRQFFILLSSLSWAEPVPELCLEALWSVLGPDGMFPLVVSKLVEGSLLIKLEQQLLYHVHDMVSLYLDVKKESVVSTILVNASLENIAFIAPWLFIFGKESVQEMAEEKMESFLRKFRNKEVVILLESMVQALMASKSISELETSKLGFRRILSPVMYEFISSESQELLTAAAKCITTVFEPGDYATLAKSLEETNSIGNLLNFLKLCEESEFLTVVSLVVAKLAEHFSAPTVDNILACIPMDRLSELLSPETEEFHESVFTILLSLAEAGKLIAIETMFRCGVDKRLIVLLVKGSDVAQNNAIVTLKAFNELGAHLDQGCFQPGELNLLPWNARLSLERFVFSDSRIDIPSPKPQTFKILLHKILGKDGKEVVEAIQGLIPIAEKASDPRTQDLILGSGLIERLGFLLQSGEIDQTQVRSESAFLIMKLACTGGDPFVQKFIQLDMVSTLIKMMQCNIKELQDSAYTALHQIVFAKGGAKVLTKFLQTGQIEMLVRLLDRKCIKTKEVVMLFLVDLVEIGSKPCIERMISCQIVEKLVGLEKTGGELSGSVLRFLKGLDLCNNLSSAERMVMKQQVVRKVRVAARGHMIEGSLVASAESCLSDSWGGASSSGRKK